jgi:transcriptional regulator with XRE-family HTH domain
MAVRRRYPRKDPKAVLGEALRQLRQDAGLSQAAVAAKIDGYGEDSVQKAESGKQVPVDDFYEKLLTLYAATPRERIILDVLLEHALTADPVIPGAEAWIKDVEPKAATVYCWSLDTLPGLTQTYDYALAMYRKAGLSEEKAAERAKARTDRSAILTRPEPARLTAIIYETLLHRQVGTPDTMVGELEHLLELMDMPNVTIQVVRESQYYFPGHDGEFMIAAGRAIPNTLNMVNLADYMVTAPAVVDYAIMFFDQIRGHALSAAESRALTQEALQRWKARQQSAPSGASPATATGAQATA